MSDTKSVKQESKYVLGFLLQKEDYYFNVAMILKSKPDWQAGKWNGIGGKIEEGETPLQAMIREFKEETGAKVEDWKYYAQMFWDGGFVDVFYAVDWDCSYQINTQPGEDCIMWRSCLSVADMSENMVPNTRWLVPMAICRLTERFTAAIKLCPK